MFVLALALLALQTAAVATRTADSLTGLGVSRVLATERAAQLSEVRYRLALEVTRRDTAYGTVHIGFKRRGTGAVILDFRGLASSDVMVNGAPSTPRAVNGHLVFAGAAFSRGVNEISLRFRSAIAPSGASVIRFHDATDGADYLYTLLVPADANQLFPCFDQPDLKARVTLSVTTPPGWTALANGVAEHVDSGAVRTFHFAATPPISTYLVAFAAGPWTVTHRVRDGRPINVYMRASRAREVEVDSLVDLNARAIGWLERYTARSYPFGKFDFLLAPAFPFGGMEHPGAIFYNEESFVYRERPTLSQLLGREATIFHEVAHQWFGDYATMRWFDDLWLKEGFATYLAAVMQSDLSPSANAWKTFYLRNKPVAYAVDASAGTTPVWQQLGNLDQAKSNYGAIVYNKAPGILKQLNHLVGDTAFRDGLREYLRGHAYGNATWRDLLAAVGLASHRSLSEWGRSYVLRPGMPVLTQELTVRDGRIARLTLTQAPAEPLSGPAPWPIRVQLLLGYSGVPARKLEVEITGRTTVVPAAGMPTPDWLFANANDYGYALVRLDPHSREWLEVHVAEERDDFLRAMLWGTLWDEVRDARLDPVRFVRAALRDLPRETDEQLVPVVVGRVSHALTAYVGAAARDSLRPEVERVFRRGATDGARSYGVRKNHLDAYIAVAGSASALHDLDVLLDSASLEGLPLRPPTRWAIVTTLLARGAPGAEQRLAAEVQRDSTSEGRRRAFVAGAARPDSSAKAAYWDRYFRDATLNEDWVTASLRAFNDPLQERLTARYLVPALDSLPLIQRTRRIFFLGSWVNAVLDGQQSAESLAAVDAVLVRGLLSRDLREKVLQARDELERTVVIRRTYGDLGRAR